MRTTLDIDQDAYRLARAVAEQQGISLGKVVAEAVIRQYGRPGPASQQIGRSEAGFPTLRVGRPITKEDVIQLDDE